MKNIKTLKVLFIVLTMLMITSIIFGVMTENDRDLSVSDRILAGMIGSLIATAINYVVYKLLSKIWK
ncbi:hypothetical protein ABE41_016455 [Fictibacillus arsenicus]|uniref:Uncharacterized protein n=1 Tax=Fictibacillus arsenicus TaxID=255247 RepID=A0A1B1Z843_9BACL|nr:hypothetical protein ABE41_016455 [Fictibacillus arsenicus]